MTNHEMKTKIYELGERCFVMGRRSHICELQNKNPHDDPIYKSISADVEDIRNQLYAEIDKK